MDYLEGNFSRYELVGKKSFHNVVVGSEDYEKVVNKMHSFYGPMRYKNRMHFREFETSRGERHSRFLKLFPVRQNSSFIKKIISLIHIS